MIKLPSGLRIDANCDIVGIDREGEVFEGYDGALDAGAIKRANGDTFRGKLSAEDKRALADVMIARWAAYGGPNVEVLTVIREMRKCEGSLYGFDNEIVEKAEKLISLTPSPDAP